MRIASVLTLIAAAAVSFSASAAPANTNVDTSVASVAVNAPSTYKLTRSELAGVQGVYALDDGRTMHVTAKHHRVYAELNGSKTELVPVAPNQFVSPDDAVRVVFNSTEVPGDVKVSTIAQ